MASKRLISIDFFSDHSLVTAVSRDARFMYVGLWNLADDQGALRVDVAAWKNSIFPWDADVTFDTIELYMTELVDAKRAGIYCHGGIDYLWLPKLLKNQPGLNKICRKCPAPPESLQESLLGAYGAQEYRDIIDRIDERARRRGGKPTQEQPAPKPVTSRIAPEVVCAAEQTVGRPISVKERQILIDALSMPTVHPAWIVRALEETAAKRSISYACAIVKRWAVEGLPSRSNGRTEPAPVVATNLMPDLPLDD